MCMYVGANVYFEYVRSHANPADLPSRDAIPEMLRVLRSFVGDMSIMQIPCIMPGPHDFFAHTRMWIDAPRAVALLRRRADAEAAARRGGSVATGNRAVEAASRHGTSIHNGNAADSVAQADYSMAEVDGEPIPASITTVAPASRAQVGPIGQGFFAVSAIKKGQTVAAFIDPKVIKQAESTQLLPLPDGATSPRARSSPSITGPKTRMSSTTSTRLNMRMSTCGRRRPSERFPRRGVAPSAPAASPKGT
jgi:hypothetical protein